LHWFGKGKEEYEEPHLTRLILFIEDDEHIRRQLTLSLKNEGYQVDEAGSGEEGLEAFDHHPADIVLVDLRLPGIDGFEVSRRLRARTTTSSSRSLPKSSRPAFGPSFGE
jgi:CheY-like chemotaxis protein